MRPGNALPGPATAGGGALMSYVVDRIPGSIRIDPDAGGQERQRKREKPVRKSDGMDSVSISEEAKRRSSLADGADSGERADSSG